MRGEKRRTDRDVLRECWCQWTAIVALFARKDPARRRVDPEAYATLRNEVIAACRSLAEPDGPERPFYASLEQTVRPWLDLRALERTDREILGGLLVSCRDAECQLKGRKSRLDWAGHWKPAMVIVAGGVVIGGLFWLFPSEGLWVFNSVRDLAVIVWLKIKYADDWSKGCGIAVMVIVAAIYTVWRSARA
jgi:hypothetical protein